MAAEQRVHIIDDDEGVRDSLAFMLENLEIPSVTYESGVEFLDQISADQRGCIVTDVRMPDISGIELLRRIKEAKLSMPVIVITGHGDVPLAVEAMRLGAFDFLEKPFEEAAIVASIRRALNDAQEAEKAGAERAELAKRIDSLTGRERDVLNGLIAGQSNKMIAQELSISHRTIEIYRANVMTKMQANNLSELVRMALQAGLLRSD